MKLISRSAPRLSRLQGYRSLTTLGIRREDPSRIWERRTPLTPEAVGRLIQSSNQVGVEIESCHRRCFKDYEYAQSGAKVVEALSDKVDLVLGIKEPPLSDVQALMGRKRTWMMFSHTHKGQEYNTSLLATLMAGQQTIIDHELLTAPIEGKLKRIAGFGWYAGAVGAGEALSLTGLALLKRGIASPLLHLPRPYTFTSLSDFRTALRETGAKIRAQPAESRTKEGPTVIGLTGAGNVSAGAKSILEELGVEWVSPDVLPHLENDGRIYACAIHPSSYFKRKDDGNYSREDYYQNPGSYESVFTTKIAPYITTLINGAGWQSGFPRIMTTANLASIPEGKRKMIAIQDVSCDLHGGLEFIDRHTTIDHPYFESCGTLLSSTDILPTELPTDASIHFSDKIYPYVGYVLSASAGDGTEVRKTLKRGTIVDEGRLTGGHEWLQPNVDTYLKSVSSSTNGNIRTPVPQEGSAISDERKKRILLLGSGLVAGPAVEVFTARGDILLAIASNNPIEARALAKGRQGIEILELDVNDNQALSEAVSSCDVVVSLLPAPMHPTIAEHCLNHGKHLVTASYISPEMQALDQRAKEKGVILLGECGLDPGIDSMAAMRILSRVRKEGKRVSSFVSWCGGLPEPSASNVPLGYKFSWSPKGVLSAALNEAKYKLDNQIHHVSGDKLLSEHFPNVPIWKGLALEGLANRNSIPYAKKYGMGEESGLRDIFRGTLRYQGFSRLLDSFRKMGFLSSKQLEKRPEDWNEFLRLSLGSAVGDRVSNGDVKDVMRHLLGPESEEVEDAMRWLSLLPSASRSTHKDQVKIPHTQIPMDLFASLLSRKLAYQGNERDTVLLHHTFRLHPTSPPIPHSSSSIDHQPAQKEETITASLNITGTSEHSAMALTVGSTLAFASCRVLDGSIRSRGVRGPYEREVWEGVLDDLESVGVEVKDVWS